MLIVTSATLGQALLSLALLAFPLVTGRGRRSADAPLALALGALTVVLGAAVLTSLPKLDHGLLFALSLPAWLALAPAVALFVEALTTEADWRLQRRHARAFLLAGLATAAIPLTLMLSPETRRAMMVEGRAPDAGARALGVLLFALIMAGTVSAALHGWRDLRRLTLYRARVAALFSENGRRELRWLEALAALVGAAWLLAVIALLVDGLLGSVPVLTVLAQGLGLAAAWALSLLGLRQAPGFEGREVEPAVVEAVMADLAKAPTKYRRSALTPDQAERTAARIEAVMREEQLYLDPTLSLPRLAARLRLSPNLVSQSLNERVGESFFAYVNRWRAEAAAPLVLAGGKTMLEIALEVGFNSKSAFYKAFRTRFGTSPARYRA